jgi:F-type H+-transporting ATPase subunit delta
MNNSKISVRYAKALIENASENNVLPEIKLNIDFLIQCIHQISELQIVLKSPVIKTSEKINIFKLAFTSSIHPLTLSFLNLILINKREEFLEAICRHVIFLYNIKMNIKPGLLVTTKPLDIQTKEKIISVIAKKLNAKIELQEKYDESLLGGFILRIDDQQIDASIASHIAKIKNELIA